MGDRRRHGSALIMAELNSERFRTPLSRARGTGAARHGVSHFMTER
ncbi:MAG: succinate dehydrogenase, partial [Caulobacter sp. 39-67-4]